jgi:peptidoglycan/xylan/chitin deacetylase (PgdA/CDA1 family)
MKAALRRTLLRCTGTPPFAGLVAALERIGPARRGLLWVLTYHRVDEPAARPELDPDLISATPAAFARQAAYLAEHCRVVSLADVLAALDGRHELPPRAVLVTFDDAYRDFAEHAWPILRRHNLPVTLFVPTSYPDQPRRFWWDRLHRALTLAAARQGFLDGPLGRHMLASPSDVAAARRAIKQHVKTLPHADAMRQIDRLCAGAETAPHEAAPGEAAHDETATGNAGPAANGPPVLGWDELRRLHAEGVTLAPHTQTHPLLHRVSDAEAAREASGSLADLRREIGADVPAVLAYPSGGHDDGVARNVRRLGFAAAFTTDRGANRLASIDRQRIRRINVGRGTSLPLLRAQLLPCAAWV